jgi:hypothetical protein
MDSSKIKAILLAIIAAFAAIGLDRLICFPTKRQPTLEAQARFAEDCLAAGVQLA